MFVQKIFGFGMGPYLAVLLRPALFDGPVADEGLGTRNLTAGARTALEHVNLTTVLRSSNG
jgi:hypothetical protein